jgi:hypothetical protein
MTGKRAHEQAKKDRAEAKRARREARASTDDTATPVAGDDRTEAQLVEHLKNLQDAFGRGELTFERFDTERAEVLRAMEALEH